MNFLSYYRRIIAGLAVFTLVLFINGLQCSDTCRTNGTNTINDDKCCTGNPSYCCPDYLRKGPIVWIVFGCMTLFMMLALGFVACMKKPALEDKEQAQTRIYPVQITNTHPLQFHTPSEQLVNNLRTPLLYPQPQRQAYPPMYQAEGYSPAPTKAAPQPHPSVQPYQPPPYCAVVGTPNYGFQSSVLTDPPPVVYGSNSNAVAGKTTPITFQYSGWEHPGHVNSNGVSTMEKPQLPARIDLTPSVPGQW